MNNKPFTIQINSLEALERLLGGSSQMEVDVRNSIVHAFTKKYLKSIALTEPLARAASEVSRHLQISLDAEIALQVGSIKRTYYSTLESVKPNEEIKTAIQAAARDAVEKLIQAAVKEAVAHIDLKAAVNKTVAAHVDFRVREQMQKLLSDAVKKV